jgi:lipid II:glycine glycyltransferase (peptidoglycan interpeptide bridge formation enzyme)
MMGAGKPGDGYGVREFKSEFGGELVEHGRFLYVCKPQLYVLGKFMVRRLKNGKK